MLLGKTARGRWAKKGRIMISKLVLLASVSGMMLFVSIPSVFAAAASDSEQCTVHGIVSGGGFVNSQSVTFNFGSTGTASPTWKGGFGEGALALSCGLFNAQVDAAVYDQTTGVVPATDPNLVLGSWLRQGHYGGAVFLRDQSVGAIGLSASKVLNIASLTRIGGTFDGDNGYTRYGAFGEYYLNENTTLAASGHYFNGSFPYFNNGYSGFELAALATYYPSENLAITGRVDALLSQLEFNTGPDQINGLALTLGGEYLVQDTNLSVFANGIFGYRKETFPTSTDTIEVKDLVASVGFKFAFGGAGFNSLVARDRSGTYDNTSLWLEKLPDFISSAPN